VDSVECGTNPFKP